MSFLDDAAHEFEHKLGQWVDRLASGVLNDFNMTFEVVKKKLRVGNRKTTLYSVVIKDHEYNVVWAANCGSDHTGGDEIARRLRRCFENKRAMTYDANEKRFVVHLDNSSPNALSNSLTKMFYC